MRVNARAVLNATALMMIAAVGRSHASAHAPPVCALINGSWFNGKSFERRTVYTINGRFTFRKPKDVEKLVDLAGTFIVPPFAEAHNHNIGTGVEEQEKRAIQKYLAEGVFYVKIPGNLAMTRDKKQRLSIGQHDSVDAVFSQSSLTCTGGAPIHLIENLLLPQGVYPGHTKETLKDLRYFTIDSDDDLEKKWPLIVSAAPDFIKTFLVFSEEFDKRREAPSYFGRRGLEPRLLSKIVAKAHGHNLRVTTHVQTAADFHEAVAAGVDEIAHLPPSSFRLPEDKSVTPISMEDARLAARRGVTVDTTAATAANMPEPERSQHRQRQAASLKLLHSTGVNIAIGSDNVTDSSLQEISYLHDLGVFDNLTLLKLWTEATVKTIFPDRKLGALREGYEASFLALEGNPIDDWQSVRRIKIRFKQGFVVEK